MDMRNLMKSVEENKADFYEELHREEDEQLRLSKIEMRNLKIDNDIDKVLSKLIVYVRVFQQFDIYKDRDLDEIVSIINAIPHNRGLTRNGVFFDGTFDYLLNNEGLLNEQAALFVKEHNDKEYSSSSLNDFLNFIRKNFSEDTK